MNAGVAEDDLQWCLYCPLISVVLGDVIDIGESNRGFTADLISI